MSKRFALLIPCLAIIAASSEAATLSGRVQVTDKSGARADRANVVVWLEGPGAANLPKKKPVAKSFEMMSKDKKFQPTLLVVPVGTEINFPNVDPIYHNVFSVSGDNRFDLGLYKSGASRTKKFDKPGLVRVYCNIHSQMVGFIHVLDSPLWAVTDGSGGFEMKGVPPGHYTLRFWEEKAGESSKEIDVSESSAPITLEIDARGFVPKPHLNKYGKSYEKKSGDDERY